MAAQRRNHGRPNRRPSSDHRWQRLAGRRRGARSLSEDGISRASPDDSAPDAPGIDAWSDALWVSGTSNFIRRQPDEVDRRVRRIFLTDAGRELQRKVHGIGEATERHMLAGIGRDDLDVVMRVLDVLDAALDENTV